MEVCRLCLDLLHDNNFCHLEGPHKEMIQLVTPELNLEISPNPTACKGCLDSLDKLYKFKKKFFEIERDIKEKLNNRPNNLGLREIVKGVSNGDAALTDKAKDRLCRTCLECIECESFTVLTPSNPDAYLDSMLIMCLPELDLKLSKDPVMCEKCFNNLQELHHLKSTSLDVEEKINNYCALQGTNSHSQINLHNVLQSSVNTKSQYSNLVFVKTEEIDDDNVDNATKEIVMPESKNGTESPMVKLEDMDVKVEGADEEDKCQLNANDQSRKRLRKSTIISTTKSKKSNTAKQLTCDQCGEKFEHKQRMQVHRMLHFGKQPPTCNVCGQQFPHKSTLKLHQQVHLKDKPFKCTTCGRQFVTQYNYNLHVQIHNPEKIFACDQCDEAFLNFSNLRVHRLVHLGKDHLVCEVCNMKFIHKSVFKVHKLTHVSNEYRPFPCDLCGARFTMNSIMMRHKQMHSGEKPYQCYTCNMKFNQKSNLKKHILVHLGDKSFTCDICHKNFAAKHTLKLHLDSHNALKPHKCNECNEHFKSIASLEVHKLIHKGKEPFKCDICGMLFAKHWKFKAHRYTHEGIRPSECKMCGKRFVKDSVLISHIRAIHTGDKPFECSFCGRRYADKSKLNYHMKKRCLNPDFIPKEFRNSVIKVENF